MVKKSQCQGCYDNFYNGNNYLNVEECWHFKDAKTIWCKVIPINVYPCEYYKYQKQRKPDCYNERGCTTFRQGTPYYNAKKGDYV